MKRLSRRGEQFDVIELFASMARKYGYRLDDADSQKDFVTRVVSAFEQSRQNPITIHGKRVETLFSYVVGALGAATLIKKEDAGEVFYSGQKVTPPDYRVILKDGQQFLVEVKNFHSNNPQRKFSIKKQYFAQLKRYAELSCIPLKVAIYFSAWNYWVLLSPEAFEEGRNEYFINPLVAIGRSEMAVIGDCMVATTPDLELRLEVKQISTQASTKQGTAKIKIQNIRMFCAGNEIWDDLEKRLCFYFVRFGRWLEHGPNAVIRDDEVIAIRFIFSPVDRSDQQSFFVIGTLSSMVSNDYREATVEGDKVFAISSQVEPEAFEALIPEDYIGKQLPLWRFSQKPNEAFSVAGT